MNEGAASNANVRHILVTGASDGIGHETARALLARGHHVLVHGRDAARARAAVEALAADGGEARAVWGDFSRMHEVVALAQQVAALAPRLDVLINNAGLYARRREITVDGFELTMGVNHFAPYLLTRRLSALLEQTPGARVVNVSSMTHEGADLDVHDLDLARHWDAYAAYATSKLANVLFTRALSQRLAGVTANALHPGVIGTKLLQSAFRMRGADVADGARTPVYLATATEVATVSGDYFVDCRARTLGRRARDAGLAEALWQASERRLAAWL